MSKTITPRHCEHCTQPITPRPTEGTVAYGRRRYCGTGCSAAARSAAFAAVAAQRARDGKTCVVCGREFFREHGRSGPAWEKRRACSKACATTDSNLRRSLGAPRKPRPRPAVRRPAAAPIPMTTATTPAAPWRPAGFAPTPDTRPCTPGGAS